MASYSEATARDYAEKYLELLKTMNKQKAANQLGVSRDTLRKWVARYHPGVIEGKGPREGRSSPSLVTIPLDHHTAGKMVIALIGVPEGIKDCLKAVVELIRE